MCKLKWKALQKHFSTHRLCEALCSHWKPYWNPCGRVAPGCQELYSPVTEGSRCLQWLKQMFCRWVLIPLPSASGFHKGSRVGAHIATALTADWTEGVLSPLARQGHSSFLPTWQHQLLRSPYQLSCLGNLKGNNSRTIITEYSSTSPQSLCLKIGSNSQGKRLFQLVSPKKTEDKEGGWLEEIYHFTFQVDQVWLPSKNTEEAHKKLPWIHRVPSI